MVTDSSDLDNVNMLFTQLKNQDYLDQLNSLKKQPILYSEPQTPLSTLSDAEKQMLKIFNAADFQNLRKFLRQNRIYERLDLDKIKCKAQLRKISLQNGKAHSHIDKNYHLGNKKALFYNIKNYCLSKNLDPFDYIPLTFHIQDGVNDQEYKNFQNYYQKKLNG